MKNKLAPLNLQNISDISNNSGISKEYIYRFITKSPDDFNNQKYYRNFSISKKNHGIRTINAPLPTLAILQSYIKDNILDLYPQKISKYAKAYKYHTSIKDNVRFHRSSKFIIKLDIVDFFGNIDNKKVFLLFKSMGLSTEVSSVLSLICSLNDHSIPQGSVTSPQISNMIMFHFDNYIGDYATKKFIRYTRYADDITISGNDINDLKTVSTKIATMLYKMGFEINSRKRQLLLPSQKQRITGITVNSVLNVDIKVRKNLRLELHHYLSDHSQYHLLSKLGHGYNDYDHLTYARRLLGKINFILYVNPKNKDYFLNAKYKILKNIDQIKNNKH